MVLFNLLRGLFKRNENTYKVKMKETIVSSTPKSMDISLRNEQLNIEYGAVFKVISNDPELTMETDYESNTLKISSKKKFEDLSNLETTVVMPRHTVFNEFNVKLANGNCAIGSLKTNKANIDVTTGDVVIGSLHNNESAIINVTTGGIDIRNGDMNNLSAKVKTGAIDVFGALYGNNELEVTVGDLVFTSSRQLSHFNIDAEIEVGEIKIGDEFIQKFTQNDGTDNLKFKINVGDGEIYYDPDNEYNVD